jgi:hypothetical protein
VTCRGQRFALATFHDSSPTRGVVLVQGTIPR